MKLIDKQLSDQIQIDEGEGATRMRFLFLMANRKTDNGNIYGPDVLKAAAGEFAQKVEKYGPAFGSPGHVPNLELNDVSHMIENVEWDNERQGLVADIKILPTQKGRNVSAIIKNGGRVGVSARGEGQKEADGRISKYSFRGVDFTLSPSTGTFVGENETVFESAALDEEKIDIAESRYRTAVVAGYQKDFASYKKEIFLPLLESMRDKIGDHHADSIDRTKGVPQAADGFPTTYAPGNPQDDDVTEEDIAALDVAFAEALAAQYPNLTLADWDENYILAFDKNASQFYQLEHGLGEEKGVTLGEPEPVEVI